MPVEQETLTAGGARHQCALSLRRDHERFATFWASCPIQAHRRISDGGVLRDGGILSFTGHRLQGASKIDHAAEAVAAVQCVQSANCRKMRRADNRGLRSHSRKNSAGSIDRKGSQFLAGTVSGVAG